MLKFINIEKNIPRWSIFLLDVLTCIFSIFLAYLLRFNFQIPHTEIESFIVVIPFVLAVRILSFEIFKTYAGIIRHTSTEDGIRLFFTITSGSTLFALANVVNFFFFHQYVIPFSIIIIDYFVTIFFMTAFRLMVKVLYLEFRTADKQKNNVIIYGAGEAGIITKRTLESDQSMNYKVIGFVDNNPVLARKKIEGVTIVDARRGLHRLLRTQDVDLMVFADPSVPREQKRYAVDLCLRYKAKVLNVPPMSRWINGELSFNQIRQVRIEDMLGREPIRLDSTISRRQLAGRKVLVTGAAGSIGSELVRQILDCSPALVVMLDQAESPLYELEQELNAAKYVSLFEVVVGDVTNAARLENVFRTFLPEFVYHAAAYKHVPMMEDNPSEAIFTNVEGTRITADLAVRYKAEKFVLVSTDKAVNPTNVMGASKRIAEMYVQSLDRKLQDESYRHHTRFITTRFGNVLGSNGSVVSLFARQINAGGPVTVTHPDVTRYFMTIPEACQLVLEAGAMGNGGEIYIFDMGESVKIVDLARKMIALSGLEPGKDIRIVFTGLRPGEKLYEELLNNEENTIPTHHAKIMIARVREYEHEAVIRDIRELIELFPSQNNRRIVQKMKAMVPEYISNNSVFESLDVP